MMMMMMKRLCSIEHSSYDNYFLENHSLFESIYGKNHVGKIKDLFYCYIFRTCHLSNLSLFDVWPLLSYFGFLKVSWFVKELYLRLITDQSILTIMSFFH